MLAQTKWKAVLCLLSVRLLFSSMAVICTTWQTSCKGSIEVFTDSVYHLAGGCEWRCMEKLHNQLKSLIKTLLYKLESIIIPSRCSGNEPIHTYTCTRSHFHTNMRQTWRGEQAGVFHGYYRGLRGQHLCTFIGAKESFCISKEFN